jgi:hypothetical protein
MAAECAHDPVEIVAAPGDPERFALAAMQLSGLALSCLAFPPCFSSSLSRWMPLSPGCCGPLLEASSWP